MENFKRLWYKNYLSLREHSRNLYQSTWENKIKAGDIILTEALSKPRPFWLMGAVVQIVKGFDNKIRTFLWVLKGPQLTFETGPYLRESVVQW